jgi:hypothetical protein
VISRIEGQFLEVLQEDITNHCLECAAQVHAMILLEEIVAHLKILRSQVDFQKLHDGFQLQWERSGNV